MASVVDTLAQRRKDKRWLIFQKAFVTYNGGVYEPSTQYPLQIKVDPGYGLPGDSGYRAPVYVNVVGDPWILVDEIGSFDLAKKKVVELAQTQGLAKVKLSRCVDLYTVLYPIS